MLNHYHYKFLTVATLVTITSLCTYFLMLPRTTTEDKQVVPKSAGIAITQT